MTETGARGGAINQTKHGGENQAMVDQLGGGKAGIVYNESNPKLVAELKRRIESDPNKYTGRYIGAQVGALAKHGSYSGSYVSTYLNKGWTGDEFEPALREWLEQDKSERDRRWKNQFFLKNPITDDVAMWLNYCMTQGKCVAITGDSGIGKTETTDHCLKDKRGVFRIQCGPGMNSAKDLSNVLVDKIGEDHPAFDMASNQQEGLARFFTQHAFAIALDDFDLLIPSAYEFLLRYLWNVTRLADKTVPIFMTGNIGGVRNLRKLSPQLASRVRHVNLVVRDCFKLPLVRQFMQHHLEGIELTNEMLKAGTELANAADLGHLRALFDVCQEVKYALKMDEEKDVETLFFDRIKENSEDTIAPILRRVITAAPARPAITAGVPV